MGPGRAAADAPLICFDLSESLDAEAALAGDSASRRGSAPVSPAGTAVPPEQAPPQAAARPVPPAIVTVLRPAAPTPDDAGAAPAAEEAEEKEDTLASTAGYTACGGLSEGPFYDGCSAASSSSPSQAAAWAPPYDCGSAASGGSVSQAVSAGLARYGSLLRQEQERKRGAEEQLLQEQAALDVLEGEMGLRHEQWRLEKRDLLDRIQQQAEMLDFQRQATAVQREHEHEAAQKERAKLHEVLRQQGLGQREMLREISTLVLEREALRKEVARSRQPLGLPYARARSSSCGELPGGRGSAVGSRPRPGPIATGAQSAAPARPGSPRRGSQKAAREGPLCSKLPVATRMAIARRLFEPEGDGPPVASSSRARV